jgi:protease-4
LDRLYELADNKDIQGIVVRVDSPGGAVGPSQELYTAIKKIKDKKPVVVSMGSIAASGGLYLSLAANKIFCQPGTLTGSIGVIMQSPNFSSIADKVGFTMTTVKSGKLKDVGNPFRPVSAEDQAFLQGVVMNIYSQFVDAVVEGRSIPREEVLKFADGRIIPGSVAKELKLVDEFGDVHDAARAVFALKNRPLAEGEQPHLIYPGKKFSKLKELFGVVEQIGERLSTSSKVKFLVDF